MAELVISTIKFLDNSSPTSAPAGEAIAMGNALRYATGSASLFLSDCDTVDNAVVNGLCMSAAGLTKTVTMAPLASLIEISGGSPVKGTAYFVKDGKLYPYGADLATNDFVTQAALCVATNTLKIMNVPTGQQKPA
jgi:hypothetical protein